MFYQDKKVQTLLNNTFKENMAELSICYIQNLHMKIKLYLFQW